MSIKIMSWVWENSPYEGKALLVHLALADYCNDEGICWPSQRSIAAKARTTDRYVRECVRMMRTDDYVEILKESDGIHSHKYRLKARKSVPDRNSVTIGAELSNHLTGNLTPKNRHEPSIIYNCPYCRSRKPEHFCSAMNQRMR